MELKELQKRIKGSHIYICKNKNERLYFHFRSNNKNYRVTTWFEIVNDHIEPFVIVENYKKESLYDKNAENYIAQNIRTQFREIINDCELKRVKTPLCIRLKDDVVPVYDDSSLKHQIDALRFCCSMKVSALYADTGTGKSKIAIDLAISRYYAGQINKVLVFLPVSTKKNFQKQIELWCKCDCIIWKLIGHESMGSSEKAIFEAMNFVDNETLIIIDESHFIKNPTAKRSKRINMVCQKTSYKLVMTGTPVTDNVHNLYMQYAVLSPIIIGVRDWKKFEEKYLVMGGINNDEIIAYKNIDHLMGLLEPYTYQISKEQCLDIPAKTEMSNICRMTEDQEYYYNIEKELLLEKIRSDDFTSTDIFQSFTKMQQICCGYYIDKHKNKVPVSTNKMSLMKNIPLCEPTIFFCKYLFEINDIVNYLGKENCSIFTGMNPRERDDELQNFVSGNTRFFVATMQSGGTGLNGLQEVSRRVVFFSNSFSFFHRKQSIGRIDRQGQTREMYINDFMTDSKIDSRIMFNLKRKSDLATEIKILMSNKEKLREYVNSL